MVTMAAPSLLAARGVAVADEELGFLASTLGLEEPQSPLFYSEHTVPIILFPVPHLVPWSTPHLYNTPFHVFLFLICFGEHTSVSVLTSLSVVFSKRLIQRLATSID